MSINSKKEEQIKKNGQAMIFTMMAIVILVFVVLYNYDLHRILFVKSKTQNAGDAAAMMGARWQAITLNIVGDLNIMNALALSGGDPTEIEETTAACSNMQARLLYVGPMIGLMGTQQAAKNNGMYVNNDYSDNLKEHAREVKEDYPRDVGDDGNMLFPEPYEGCWNEYSAMLQLIAADGLAAGPDNAQFYGDSSGGHILYEKGFYGAVAGPSWCWFYHNEPSLLSDYDNYHWWPALPEPPHRLYINSEIFGIHLTKATTRLEDLVDLDVIGTVSTDRELAEDSSWTESTNLEESATWYCYNDEWTDWANFKNYGDWVFPKAGDIKPQYDYSGADACIRIEAPTERLTPNPGGKTNWSTITWTAAAKPFGYLNESDPPTFADIVLPAFRKVALIPVDASLYPNASSYDLTWRKHIEVHLPKYIDGGTAAIQADSEMQACFYCQQLITWEDDAFRQSGIDWLDVNSGQCRPIHGSGGGGGGGGPPRGH